MNAEDIQLMKAIISRINTNSNGNKPLLSVNYVRIAKTNLILLKALLEEQHKKGIFVTIDRPHQYMEHLLRMHRIDYTNLLFIDTIAGFSGGGFNDTEGKENVKLMSSPFQIDLLPDLFSFNPADTNGPQGKISLNNVDFILIDNIAAMLNYNDSEMVEGFLENYLAKFNDVNNILIPLILDRNNHSHLYDVARRLCDNEIDIEKLEVKKSGMDKDERERSLLSHEKTNLDLFSYRKCFTGGG